MTTLLLPSLVVIVSFVVVNAIPANSSSKQLETELESLLNKWRLGPLHTDLLPLPSLQSIFIGDVQSTYDGNGLKIRYSIKNMKLEGLDKFSVKELNVTETKDNLEISVILDVAVLNLTADYKLDGRAYYVYRMTGAGNMVIIFRDTEVRAVISVGFINGTNTRIEDFLLDYNVSKVEANMENSSWPINKVLNAVGLEIIDSYHGTIRDALWGYVIPYANEYLAGITPDEFMNTICCLSVNSYVMNSTII